MNFRTAIVDEHGHLITDTKKIACSYLKVGPPLFCEAPARLDRQPHAAGTDSLRNSFCSQKSDGARSSLIVLWCPLPPAAGLVLDRLWLDRAYPVHHA